MHEHGLIKNILTKVLEEAKKHGARKISKIKIKVGPLSQFTPQSFEEHFRDTSADTLAEKAVLEISAYAAVGQCLECKKEFELSPINNSCPFCQSPHFAIISGKEVILGSVEVE